MNTRILKTAALCALLCAFLAAPALAEQIRLRTGDLLQGKVLESSTEERLAIRLFETGGIFTIEWGQLIPEDERRIREMLGYIEVDISAIPSRPGHVVLLLNGTKVFGLVENPRDTTGPVRVKQSDGVREYPRETVAEVRNVDVDALDIYTPEELAEIYFQEINPETPAAWVEFGDLCYQAGAYVRAKEAYDTALMVPEYADSDRASTVRGRLKRLDILVRAKDATDRLRTVRRLSFQNRFDQALDLLTDLEEEYAESPAILKELNLERYYRQVSGERRKHFLGAVRRSFYKLLDKLVNKKVREKTWDKEKKEDKEIGLREALLWVQNPKGLTHELFAAIAEQNGLSEEEARKFWDERTSKQVRHYNYGSATFMHPDVAARTAKATTPKRTNTRSSRNSSRNPRQNQRQKMQQQKPKSSDDWWKDAKSKHREWLLKAWFAEYGHGVLKVLRIETRPCQNCAGSGTTKHMDQSTGDTIKRICTVCNLGGGERIVICR